MLAFPFAAGCGGNNDGDWIEVQSIKYSFYFYGASHSMTHREYKNVKIKILDNNCLEIDTGESIMRVLPVCYEIVYE